MGTRPGDWLKLTERTGVTCEPMGAVATGAERFDLGRTEGGAPVDMTGLNLVRHHLQQAQLAAAFLPGGESHGSVMGPIVEQLYLTDEEAANALREDLHAAMQGLDALLP